MGLLVLVFLLPWLEGSGLAGGTDPLDRLRLAFPWNLFFLLVAGAGVVNYLPTRFAPSAAFLGVGLLGELFGLVAADRPPATRAACWDFVPAGLALAGLSAMIGRKSRAEPGLARLWAWFRDHWGAVWGLRVLERFNRAAESAGWTVRLGWPGPIDPDANVEDGAESTLKALLRRFAPADRLERASGRAPERKVDRPGADIVETPA